MIGAAKNVQPRDTVSCRFLLFDAVLSCPSNPCGLASYFSAGHPQQLFSIGKFLILAYDSTRVPVLWKNLDTTASSNAVSSSVPSTTATTQLVLAVRPCKRLRGELTSGRRWPKTLRLLRRRVFFC